MAKIIVNGNHVRTCPKKYTNLRNPEKYLDLSRWLKRPSKEELDYMREALAWQLEFDLIDWKSFGSNYAVLQEEYPVCAKRIDLKDKTHYHVVVFNNGLEIRISESTYNSFRKKTGQFRNF